MEPRIIFELADPGEDTYEEGPVIAEDLSLEVPEYEPAE